MGMIRELSYKDALLLKQKKHRDQYGLFLVEGRKIVSEIRKLAKVVAVFADNHAIETDAEYDQDSVTVISEIEMRRLSDTESPQGVVAVVEKPLSGHFLENAGNSSFYVICDRIQDPGNIGTIIRSALASGCRGIALSEGCVDLYNPKVIRSTGGAILSQNIIEDADIAHLVNEMKAKGVKIFAAAALNGVSIYESDLATSFAVIIGNEGGGISQDLMALCDKTISIPIASGVESLNAAVCASIIMFESMRQRRK